MFIWHKEERMWSVVQIYRLPEQNNYTNVPHLSENHNTATENKRDALIWEYHYAYYMDFRTQYGGHFFEKFIGLAWSLLHWFFFGSLIKNLKSIWKNSKWWIQYGGHLWKINRLREKLVQKDQIGASLFFGWLCNFSCICMLTATKRARMKLLW